MHYGLCSHFGLAWRTEAYILDAVLRKAENLNEREEGKVNVFPFVSSVGLGGRAC